MLLNIDIITYHSNLYWSYRNDIATMLVPRTMLWSISIWGKKGSPFDNLSQMNNSKNTCKILYLCMFTHAMYESSGWPSCFLIFQRSNEFYGTRTIIGTLPIGINCLRILFKYADHAIHWVFGTSLLSHTAEPCQDSCNGSAMHGMQSGLILFDVSFI